MSRYQIIFLPHENGIVAHLGEQLRHEMDTCRRFSELDSISSLWHLLREGRGRGRGGG